MGNMISFSYVYDTLSKWYNALLDFFILAFVPIHEGLSSTLQEMGITADIADAIETALRESFLGDITLAGLLLTFMGLYAILVLIRWFSPYIPAIGKLGGLIPK